MNLKKEIEQARKEYLGLTEFDSKKIFENIMKSYNKLLIDSPRAVVDYTIDIAICNMNFYNRLGKLEELNKRWGDNKFYVDLRKSAFVSEEINDDGNMESIDDILFKDIPELKIIENTSFSIKEIIELCKANNYRINIFAKEEQEHITSLEVAPYKDYEINDNIKRYLETLD